MREAYKEKLNRLRIVDDDFAKIVLDDKDVLEYIKNAVIKDEEDEIIDYNVQKLIHNPYGRSIELDVFIETTKRYINIEVENSKSRSHPKRWKFHQGQIGVYVSKPNEPFEKMKECCVIVLGNYDYFDKEWPLYEFPYRSNDRDIKLKDGSNIIYTNLMYKGDDELGKIAHDFKCSDPNDMYSDVLKKRVDYLKNSEEGVKFMCEIWDEIREEGRIEGKSQGKEENLVECIKAIMNKFQLSSIEAMEVLNVPKSNWDKYKHLFD